MDDLLPTPGVARAAHPDAPEVDRVLEPVADRVWPDQCLQASGGLFEHERGGVTRGKLELADCGPITDVQGHLVMESKGGALLVSGGEEDLPVSGVHRVLGAPVVEARFAPQVKQDLAAHALD